MKTTLPVLLILLLLGAVIVTPITTKGQTHEPTPNLEIDQNDIADADNDSEEDDEPVQRVARITYIQGDVSFLRSGVTEWSDVTENLPLLTGDQIYVGSGGRAEIQFGRGNYVRLSEKTALTITELTHTAALLEVTEGIAIIRLEKYGSAWERFEVDTPNSALVLKQDGLYRVNVRGEDDSEIIIRRGLAEVFADDGNFKVRDGQRLTIDTSPNGKLQIAIDNSNDEWDRWTYDRDRQADYIAVSSAPDYVRQYETDYDDFYGASDLTNYGSWTSYSGYGNCWVPRVSSGWAPYRSGQWIWIPRAGWTWLSNEPWGWAPYHYGRWVHLNNIGWAWSPGFNNHHYRYGRSYYQWRPALVSFFNCPSPRGNYVGWYPLAPGQRWRRSGNFGGDGFRGNNGHRHLQYPVARDANRRPSGGGNGNGNGGNGNGGNRPRFGNGVTVLPIEGFAGQGRTKFKPIAPNTELSNSFHKGARAGLPDLGNNANSFVNTRVAKPGDTSNGFRAVVKPPQEVFTRPVVTRQRTTETQAENATPRERRFIGTPGTKQYGNEVPNNKRTRGGEDSSGGNTRGGETTSGETKFERKQRMKNGDATGGAVNNGSSNPANGNGGIITDDTIRKRTRGAGEETPETRKGEAANNGDTSDNWKTRNRTAPVNQPEGEADSNARKRERANRNNEGSATDDKASKRVYVPREQPQEDTSNVEQRRQEKQQRREQQQQQEQQDQQQQQQQQKEQRRAERQEQEKQQQQQQEQQRREQQQQEQRRQEKQQQQQEQQRREQQQQQQQQEQRRAEKQQQQQEQQRQQQQQQKEQQQQQEQRREEKQQRKKGDN